MGLDRFLTNQWLAFYLIILVALDAISSIYALNTVNDAKELNPLLTMFGWNPIVSIMISHAILILILASTYLSFFRHLHDRDAQFFKGALWLMIIYYVAIVANNSLVLNR